MPSRPRFSSWFGRAGAIRDGDLVSHWLHGVAHRVAVRARASAARRHLHEATGLNGAELVLDRTSKDDRQHELRDVLDQELARLPGTLRSPVVLCYLEGLTHDEAASRLRWPVGTVRSRLARARTRLRQRLARHGLTADGVSLSASLARPSVPQALINTTVRASLSFATNQTTTAAVASASAAALAKGILHAMTITKIKLIGAVALASVLTFGGVTTLARQFGGNGGAEQPIVAVDRPLQDETETKQKAEANPPTRDRLKPLFASVEKMNGDLEASIKLNQRLRKELRALYDEIEALRSGEQTATGKMGQASTTPRKGVDKRSQDLAAKKRSEAERKKREELATIVKKGGDPHPTKPAPDEPPRHFRLGGLIMVTSSRGDRVVMYYPSSGKARPLQLSVPDGTRHEVSPSQLMSESNGIIALNLTGPKVTKVAVFDPREEVWYPLELREPVGRAIPVVGPWFVFYSLGKYVYAFTRKTRGWSVLELPQGSRPQINWNLETGEIPPTIECDGHIYTFHDQTGKWDDLDTRTILDLPEEKAKDETNRKEQEDTGVEARRIDPLIARMTRIGQQKINKLP